MQFNCVVFYFEKEASLLSLLTNIYIKSSKSSFYNGKKLSLILLI